VLKNENRGYQQLRVWQDALELYKLNSQVFQKFPFELKRVVSQAIASSDSVHRNIAEGYCRRSLKEYLNF
jgi:four helix bundle protein